MVHAAKRRALRAIIKKARPQTKSGNEDIFVMAAQLARPPDNTKRGTDNRLTPSISSPSDHTIKAKTGTSHMMFWQLTTNKGAREIRTAVTNAIFLFVNSSNVK